MRKDFPEPGLNEVKMNTANMFLFLGFVIFWVMGCGYDRDERNDWNDGDFTVMTNEMYLVNTEDSICCDGAIPRKKNVFYFIRKTDTGDTMSGCCIWAGDGEKVKIVYGMGTKQILKGREAVKWWYDGGMEWFTDRNEWQTRLLQLEK